MARYTRQRTRGAPPISSKLVTGFSRQFYVGGPSPLTALQKIEQYVMAPTDFLREITWDELHPGPPYQTGGDFASIKFAPVSRSLNGGRRFLAKPSVRTPSNYWWDYTGGFMPPNTVWGDFLANVGADPLSNSYFHSNLSLGPTAFNRMKPKLERAGLGQAIAEARDLPQMLKTTARGFHDIWKSLSPSSRNVGSRLSRIMQPKKAADHFINHQFGWVPFLKDMGDLYNLYHNSKKYIEDLERLNGSWVKRVRVHEDTQSVVVNNKGDDLFGYVPSGIRPWDNSRMDNLLQPQTKGGQLIQGSWTDSTVTINQIWYEGSFKFYNPAFDRSLAGYDSALNRIEQMQILSGTRINPSLLYKITPWTWLGDWFTGVGSVVDTMTRMAEDQLACRYLYIMTHKHVAQRHEHTQFFWDGPLSLTWDRSIETKLREVYGNPFGLALGTPLSASQIAILAALGISRH